MFIFIATNFITCENSELNLRRESEVCGGKVHATDLTRFSSAIDSSRAHSLDSLLPAIEASGEELVIGAYSENYEERKKC